MSIENDDDEVTPNANAGEWPEREPVLPPAASPQPPKPARGKTDPAITIVKPWMEEALRKHDNKLTIRSVLVAVAAVATSVIAAIIFIDNRVQAQTDSGNRAAVAEQKAQDARLTTLEKRFDRYEDRHDKQMNLALDALRVPQSVRPPPLVKDGGD